MINFNSCNACHNDICYDKAYKIAVEMCVHIRVCRWESFIGSTDI